MFCYKHTYIFPAIGMNLYNIYIPWLEKLVLDTQSRLITIFLFKIGSYFKWTSNI